MCREAFSKILDILNLLSLLEYFLYRSASLPRVRLRAAMLSMNQPSPHWPATGDHQVIPRGAR